MTDQGRIATSDTLGQIRPNPQQVRKDFDPAGLEELKNSIRERGLISPLAVCRIWPAGTPAEEVELLSLVENIQRRPDAGRNCQTSRD